MSKCTLNVQRNELQAGSSPLCLSSLFQHKLLDFVALRPTGFVFLLLFIEKKQKHKTCRPQSNKIKQFVLEKTRTSVERRQGPLALVALAHAQMRNFSACLFSLILFPLKMFVFNGKQAAELIRKCGSGAAIPHPTTLQNRHRLYILSRNKHSDATKKKISTTCHITCAEAEHLSNVAISFYPTTVLNHRLNCQLKRYFIPKD